MLQMDVERAVVAAKTEATLRSITQGAVPLLTVADVAGHPPVLGLTDLTQRIVTTLDEAVAVAQGRLYTGPMGGDTGAPQVCMDQAAGT